MSIYLREVDSESAINDDHFIFETYFAICQRAQLLIYFSRCASLILMNLFYLKIEHIFHTLHQTNQTPKSIFFCIKGE